MYYNNNRRQFDFSFMVASLHVPATNVGTTIKKKKKYTLFKNPVMCSFAFMHLRRQQQPCEIVLNLIVSLIRVCRCMLLQQTRFHNTGHIKGHDLGYGVFFFFKPNTELCQLLARSHNMIGKKKKKKER